MMEGSLTRHVIEYALNEPGELKNFSHPYIRAAEFYAKIRILGFSGKDAMKETVTRLLRISRVRAEIFGQALRTRRDESSDKDEVLGCRMSEEWAVRGAANREFDRVTTRSYMGSRLRD